MSDRPATHRRLDALPVASPGWCAAVIGLLALSLTAHADPTPAPVNPAPPAWARPVENLVTPPVSAALSPDGHRAAWVTADRKSVLSATRVDATADWAAPERLFTTRGSVGQLVFSPDGTRLAYENPRTWKDDGAADDRWAFIGVIDIASRRTVFVDPSFSVDSNPLWSADGRSLRFTRHVVGLADVQLSRPVPSPRTGVWQAPARTPAETFTMAEALATPYIYPPVPSADGRVLAYLTREGPNQRVYVLRVGERVRRVADYQNDDGRDLWGLAVSPTGTVVAYVRGGYVNRQGESPNPTSEPDMPQPQVWLVDATGAAPRYLGSGSDPQFTPDGSRVLWRAGGSVRAAALTMVGKSLAAVGVPEEFLLGAREGLRFSPDGTKATYLRGNGIEIYDLKTRIATVIPHGADTDVGPVWSPDSTRVAFRRVPSDSPGLERNFCGHGERYCGPMRSSQPWAIWVADATNPQPARIWQAEAGVGSVYYDLDQDYSPGQLGDQMFWSADDRIGFAWERDGWRHLYAVSIHGGPAQLLTPGDGEVESAGLSLDRRTIIYATNIGDMGRRHISAVSFGGAPRAVTRGDRSQWAAAPLADGRIAYVDAGWADPPRVIVRSASGTESASAEPQTRSPAAATAFVKPQLVEFPGADGQTAYGQLFVPGKPNGCAIVFSHGGIRRQMLPGFHYMDAYHYLYEMNQYLASRGCVVLSVEYRSSIMRGEVFRNAEGWGFAGNSEIRDFVGAAKYLLARADVDGKRGIGIYGLSWGGYMTAEALALHSDLFSVGFDMAGVHTVEDAPGFRNSSVGQLDTWKSPVYLIQGDDDMNVDFNQGIALAQAIQTRHPELEFRQEAVPGQTHDLYQTYETLVEVYSKGSAFLLAHLGVQP